MIRPLADAPPFPSESAEKERQKASSGVIPLEVELWIEVMLLIGVGLVMIYSASSIMALKKFGDAAHYFKRQLACIGLGIGTMLVVSRISYRRYREHIPWMFLWTLLALVLVLIPGLGSEINNARRWFNFRFFLVQPAEFAKVVWIIFLSVSLVKKQDKIKRLSVGFVPHMVLLAVFAALLMKEPDFGTTFMLGCLTIFMLMLGGVPYVYLVSLVPIARLVLLPVRVSGALPVGADHGFSGPLDRSARFGIPAHPGLDCSGFRRAPGERAGVWPTKAFLSAGVVHGLHPGGNWRGTGICGDFWSLRPLLVPVSDGNSEFRGRPPTIWDL